MILKTDFLGLPIKSPLVVGSCGLCQSIDDLLRLEDAGVGAVILKSLFEEEIIYDIKRNTHMVAPTDHYGENYDFIAQRGDERAVEKYLGKIEEAKRRVSIPVIGSIDCYSYDSWIAYAKNFEESGCDAIELNVSIHPYETSLSTDDVERTFNDIVRTMNRVTTLPVSIKVAPYFTDMAKFLQQLSWMGINGITLFNRMAGIDIDVEQMSFVECDIHKMSEDLYNTLCWVGLLHNKLKCAISAATSVSTPDDVIKLLLAGAGTVQLSSCLYSHGFDFVGKILTRLSQWMEQNQFEAIADFRGRLSVSSNEKAFIMMRTRQIKDTI